MIVIYNEYNIIIFYDLYDDLNPKTMIDDVKYYCYTIHNNMLP